jgi:anti-sigma B factor antagonist
MEMRERIEGSVLVLAVRGSLHSEMDAMEIRERINGKVLEGHKDIVLDMKELTYLNSWGLGLLVAVMTQLRRTGGDLRLAGITAQALNLFIVTQLTLVFKTYDTVDLAVASFGKAR